MGMQIFEPYAAYWIRPLLNLALIPDSGNGFHYFLRDICVLLLRWKGLDFYYLLSIIVSLTSLIDAVPNDSIEDRQLCSQFMVYLHF